MQTHLSPEFEGTLDGQAAEAILRKCVHCGFCTATCPTYQLTGDELDGPRGRIYLMKQVLEGAEVTRSTQRHLDRCLTCRNCETTCPSGVEYGHLVDIGRRIVDEKVKRPLAERGVRWLLKEGLTSPLFTPAIQAGQWVRPLLPSALKNKVPQRVSAPSSHWPEREHARKVLMHAGCVQPGLMPNINRATARVLDRAGIQSLVAPSAGCCGALRTHLGDTDGGLDDMRRNVDAWWPWVESGRVEAIISNASGCGVSLKEYGQALAHDPEYAERASRVASLVKDISEFLPELATALKDQVRLPADRMLAFHPPCTLQHGQKLKGGVETYLGQLGFDVRLPAAESHMCCGSAGTYSVLQPEMAYQLRDRKLGHLQQAQANTIVSANVGCIQHLQTGTSTPVRHWIEVLDEALSA